MNLGLAGLIVGALGDLGLQHANSAGYGNDGLKKYFASRNPNLSVLQASLLTGFWSYLGSKSEHFLVFAAYAATIDILYRYTHKTIYPSLNEYYELNSFASTIAYNVITAALVWALAGRK
jgi:hypothetical protein